MCKMLQKYSTMIKKYMQKNNKKTVDIGSSLCYYITKERETEKLEEPKRLSRCTAKSLMNDRIGINAGTASRGHTAKADKFIISTDSPKRLLN